MNKMKRRSAIVLSIATLIAGSWLANAYGQAMRLPKHTVPLTAGEVSAIFSDKTWKWDAGGGRFIAKDRKFIAYSEEGGTPAIAEGSWQVNDQGRLCMVAMWETKDGKSHAKSCFRLVRDRGTIYQRREPKGDWFVLKTYKPKPDDEFNKLVADDTVTSNIERFKATVK